MTNEMIDTNIKLVSEFIDVICLFDIIAEEQNFYFEAEADVCLNLHKKNIEVLRERKKDYLTLLN